MKEDLKDKDNDIKMKTLSNRNDDLILIEDS